MYTDLLKCSILKVKNNNITVEKNGKGIVVRNDTNKPGLLVFCHLFKNNLECTTIDFKGKILKGKQCSLNLVNRKIEVIENFNINSKTCTKRKLKYFVAQLVVEPNSASEITKINIEFSKEISASFFNNLNSDMVVISPGYPSLKNKYQCGFVHTRVKAYNEYGINIDVISTEDNIDYTMLYEFEGVKVLKISYTKLREVLQEKKYRVINLHLLNIKFANILDAVDLSKTKIYFYSHGGDTLYWDYLKLNSKYFDKDIKIPEYQIKQFNELDNFISRYNNMPNVKWIFGGDWTRRHSEELIGIKYNNYSIIHNPIDNETFKFSEKSDDLRKKIFVIKKFDNINSYANDIVTRTIIELSKKSFFNDLEFNIYGDGNYFEELTEPLREFKNVHLYRGFLTHEEIANIHKNNGIGLFPTRYDTQGVSACEAAASGCVVISTNTTGVSQFIKPEFNTLCDVEDYRQYASKIEYFYNNPLEFKKLSYKMHESIVNQCSFNNTIKKEIEMIKKDMNNFEEYVYPYKKPIDNPLLTIAVPSYNVSKYLRNSIFSLINHELCDKVEVLIINDGSKDNTAEIGRELERLTTIDGKSIVKLVDKPNGGHGSTINKGIELARGKYFKLMDGDDYFDTLELMKLIQKLENETADIILTNYVEDSSIINIHNTIRHYDFMVPGYLYDIEDLLYTNYGFGKWGPLLSTSTYKTSLLKDSNFKISEHCFYVDMEYNLNGFLHAKTVKYYPLDMYIYYIGRAGQSVSAESFVRNYKNHEHVTLRLISELYKSKNKVSDKKINYFINNTLLLMIKLQYNLTFNNFKTLKQFFEFDSKLKKYPELYNMKEVCNFKVRASRMFKNKKVVSILCKFFKGDATK